MTDPKARLEDMDLEGIDQTIMFPGGAGEEWAGLDRDFADRALPDAERLPRRVHPLQPEAAHVGRQAADDRPRGGGGRAAARASTELGMVGMVTPQHVREQEPRPSRASTSCGARPSSLDVAVCVHGGGQAIDQVPIGVDRCNTRLEVHAFTHPVGQMVAVMAFTVGGILHRFPKLRVAFLEAGTRLAAVLARAARRALGADARAGAEHRPQAERVLPLRPLLHRVRSRTRRASPHVVQSLGEDVVVYASDYCHWDCKFPDTVKIIERAHRPVGRREADTSSRTIRARLYGLA